MSFKAPCKEADTAFFTVQAALRARFKAEEARA